ncbi:excisionase family DNA binding protein [Dysgonomonas hofstadii]|uniref:Excisionase family DNA binding protein n=1 Tax=Dysgonomonas hofstadii TaxID=637886 RepID=A0A840CJX1_9BACT|nr:helix-turn-helix domain-containing protein [Dysgonomonas hofstadii]MBB4035471.1 excisionase family DNA binding protein [Dysgonomonas hofstadii]
MDNELEKRLERIENLLLGQKNVFTFIECCQYTGLSTSYMYKLTCLNKIPYYKPQGKNIYFSKEEIDKWLLKNPIKTVEQIEEEANRLVSNIYKRKF